MECLLNKDSYFIQILKQYEVRLSKYDHKENICRLEINGYRQLFEETFLNNGEENDEFGHYWLGVVGPVTSWRARHELPFEQVYVSDDVIDYWSFFSIKLKDIDKEEENIVDKGKRLIQKFHSLGELLSGLVNSVFDLDTNGFDFLKINYNEFYESGFSSEYVKKIMYHVSARHFYQSDFITRCKELNSLLNENLGERKLRDIVNLMGYPNLKVLKPLK